MEIVAKAVADADGRVVPFYLVDGSKTSGPSRQIQFSLKIVY
jgi:hypothetical protein